MANISSYFIYNTQGTAYITIQVGDVNGPAEGGTYNTDLELYGYGHPNWGQGVDRNFYKLTENFACEQSAPFLPKNSVDLQQGNGINKPLTGQQWFNLTDSEMYFCTSGPTNSWKKLMSQGTADNRYVLKVGDTMVGDLVVTHNTSAGGATILGPVDRPYIRLAIAADNSVAAIGLGSQLDPIINTINFHTSGTVGNTDSQIIATGGNSSNFEGVLTLKGYSYIDRHPPFAPISVSETISDATEGGVSGRIVDKYYSDNLYNDLLIRINNLANNIANNYYTRAQSDDIDNVNLTQPRHGGFVHQSGDNGIGYLGVSGYIYSNDTITSYETATGNHARMQGSSLDLGHYNHTATGTVQFRTSGYGGIDSYIQASEGDNSGAPHGNINIIASYAAFATGSTYILSRGNQLGDYIAIHSPGSVGISSDTYVGVSSGGNIGLAATGDATIQGNNAYIQSLGNSSHNWILAAADGRNVMDTFTGIPLPPGYNFPGNFMYGPTIVDRDPSLPLQVATKQYVDNQHTNIVQYGPAWWNDYSYLTEGPGVYTSGDTYYNGHQNPLGAYNGISSGWVAANYVDSHTGAHNMWRLGFYYPGSGKIQVNIVLSLSCIAAPTSIYAKMYYVNRENYLDTVLLDYSNPFIGNQGYTMMYDNFDGLGTEGTAMGGKIVMNYCGGIPSVSPGVYGEIFVCLYNPANRTFISNRHQGPDRKALQDPAGYDVQWYLPGAMFVTTY